MTLRIVINSLDDFVDQVIKKITLDIVANLTAAPSEGGTPVDTGWARANWIPVIGTQVGEPVGTRESVSDNAQKAAVARVVAAYRKELGPVTVGNPVPYIQFLNDGSSQQAPSGFVQRAIAKAVLVDLPLALGATPTPRGTQPRDPVTGRFLPRRR